MKENIINNITESLKFKVINNKQYKKRFPKIF